MLKNLHNEQTTYQSSFRIFVSHRNEVKFYTRNQSLTIKEIASFDSKAAHISSLELLVASFASSYMLSLKREAKKEKIALGEVEAQFTCNLTNPLELLDVVGYEEEAAISSLNGVVYIYCESTPDHVKDLAQRALHTSLIYQVLNTERIQVQIVPKIISL